MKYRLWLKGEGAMIPWRCVLFGHRLRGLYSGGPGGFCGRVPCTWSESRR